MRRHSRVQSGLRRVIASVAVLALALIGVLLSPASASATPGYSISGTVSNTSSVGVGSLSIFAYDGTDTFIEATTTAPDGSYILPGLVPGTYTLYTSSSTGYVGNEVAGVEVTASDVTGVDVTVIRYGIFSGIVSNAIGLPTNSIEVYADYWDGSSWSTRGNVSFVDSTDGSYSVAAADLTGEYRIVFIVEDDSLPLFSTYYGDTLDSPDPSPSSNAGIVNATAETDQSGLNATLLTAGYITGTVTADGSPVVGAYVEALNMDTNEGPYDADNATDTLGAYSIKVPPGTNYEVGAFATGYTDQAYKDRDGCGCQFDPVAVTAGSTTSNIDFHLDKSPEFGVQGIATDGSSFDPLTAGAGDLYGAVTGGFSLADSKTFDPSEPGLITLLGTSTGSYRIRLNDGSGHWYAIANWAYISVVDLSNTGSDPNPNGDFTTETANDVCYVPIDAVQAADAFEVVIEADTSPGAPTCGPEPAPTTPAGVTPGHHRSFFANAVTPDQAPTPTPTPTETPAPSPSPSPSANSTPTPKPVSPQEPMPWLVWLLIIVVVILIIGAIAFVLLRRR